ncbi:hypothetical protein BDZ89DRAFT_353278 [Hymenopellis radicata]|nr:hypothetical protein BDZ89DRAFT_353278 [Hymenopellis radicata]
MQRLAPAWWPLLIPLIPIYLLYMLNIMSLMRTMSMGDMLLDIMITHPLLRPVRVPQAFVLPPKWNAILVRCEDRSTLLACSLVCTSWASISREHLHLTMLLDSRAQSARLGHLRELPSCCAHAEAG